MTAPLPGSPYQVPPEPQRLRAIALALGVHAALLLFLWGGIQWQNSQPTAVEAEVWDLSTQQAAPTPPPPAEAEPQPQSAPAPEPVKAEPPAPAVDIRLEKLKAEKEKKKQLEEKKLAEKKAAAEKKAKDLAEKKAKEEQALAEKKAADAKAAKSKKALAEQKALDKLREEEMRRITGAVGSGGSGTAAQSTAPRIDSGYMAALVAKIKSNIAYSGSLDVPGAPKAVYRIEQLPTGEIIAVKKVKSSGIPAYDSAVENAIAKSSPLPKKKDGTVERSIEAVFDMKDLP
ncbi:cell envelope integrity protein TolA [Massilia sp. TS11]|uniref:cell envelope integrity protein TolA n=1 Tax=Massilia sp. TS11 TaxID=2908003 RepID=UPI001EDB0015|nr:cell envelope integrity protein TolA [Massilia sp. TS11]MCG2586150.1 cell envelope integrity protein TolA [Massilia sp. TS11]